MRKTADSIIAKCWEDADTIEECQLKLLEAGYSQVSAKFIQARYADLDEEAQ